MWKVIKLEISLPSISGFKPITGWWVLSFPYAWLVANGGGRLEVPWPAPVFRACSTLGFLGYFPP